MERTWGFVVIELYFLLQGVDYGGMLDCLWTIARREGLRGVYKGLMPASIKAMATTGLHFTFYELVIRLMREMSAS